MQVLSVGLVVAALFSLLSVSTGPTKGATLTCVQTAPIDEADWGDTFLQRLRDQGFSTPKQPLCATVMLSGEIEKNDANTLEALIQANLPFLGRLALNSNGGSVAEAMQIGRVARRYYLDTEAPSTVEGQRLPLVLWRQNHGRIGRHLRERLLLRLARRNQPNWKRSRDTSAIPARD
jgi:hypothetical protein